MNLSTRGHAQSKTLADYRARRKIAANLFQPNEAGATNNRTSAWKWRTRINHPAALREVDFAIGRDSPGKEVGKIRRSPLRLLDEIELGACPTAKTHPVPRPCRTVFV